MSYTLVAAKARSRGLDAEWAEVDISAVTIKVLFERYARIWVTLTHPTLVKPEYLELSTMRDELSSQHYMNTVQQWLDTLGNRALPTEPVLPELKLRRVHYQDAWRSGYDIKPIDRFRASDAELPEGAKNDLLLSKEGVDFRSQWRYCMVTVNGFFHRVGGQIEGLEVIDGARSGRIANDNAVGIHSFKEVGALEYIPITPQMIYRLDNRQKYADAIHIQLPPGSEGKTVLLVMGGYLHVLDDMYSRPSPNSIRINTKLLALPERIFESRKFIDLSSLPMQLLEGDKNVLGVQDLYSDENLVAYMCLPQSYLVMLKTEDFFLRRHPVTSCGLPGRFLVPGENKRFPLFGGLGRCYDHRVFNDWGTQVLATNDNWRFNYLFRTTHWRENQTIDDSLEGNNHKQFVDAFYLEMGRFQ